MNTQLRGIILQKVAEDRVVKTAAARSQMRYAALVKAAGLGDVVNAGIGSMAMGSPFAPRPYTPGTDTLKPTEQVQQEQRNAVIGGVTGLALAGAPRVAATVAPHVTNAARISGNIAALGAFGNAAAALYPVAAVAPKAGRIWQGLNRAEMGLGDLAAYGAIGAGVDTALYGGYKGVKSLIRRIGRFMKK